MPPIFSTLHIFYYIIHYICFTNWLTGCKPIYSDNSFSISSTVGRLLLNSSRSTFVSSYAAIPIGCEMSSRAYSATTSSLFLQISKPIFLSLYNVIQIFLHFILKIPLQFHSFVPHFLWIISISALNILHPLFQRHNSICSCNCIT